MIAPTLVVLAFALPGLRGEPQTPLAIAARDGRTVEVRRLLAAGADIHEEAGAGFPALAWAARAGQIESMHALVEAGAPLDGRDHGVNHWTPIMHALHKDRTEAALALLEWGAEPDATSDNGTTPLMRAACENEPRVVGALLKRGADPRRCADSDENTIDFAIGGGNPDIVRMLLRAAPDLHPSNSFEGKLTLWVARLRGKKAVLEALHEPRPHPEKAPEPQG
jgi:ankyrin repeat protein